MYVLVCIILVLYSHVHGKQVGDHHFQQVAFKQDDTDNLPACNVVNCLPFINFRGSVHLTYFQRQQIHRQREFLRTVRGRLMDGRAWAMGHTGDVVRITPVQKAKILSMYGDYFRAREDLPVRRSVQKRDVEICPRVQSWDDLVLRLTNDDELIEVVQFDDDNRQWILEETCSQSTCSFVPQCTCGTWTRHVRALVINFDQTIISERYIKVYCCIAQKISTT